MLVHGLGGSLVDWGAVAPRLSAHGRVLALDLPGFGLSPPGPDWSIETHAKAVTGFMNGLDGPAILVGNSMGGLVALTVAAESPDLVSKLVLVSPAVPPPRIPDPSMDWRIGLRLAAFAIPGAGEAIARYYRKRYGPEELVRLSLKIISHKPSRIPPDVVRELVALAATRRGLPWSMDALPRGARAVAGTWLRRSSMVARVRAISCPTLVVHGTADPIIPPSAVRWLVSLRSDWAHVELSDTGHTPQLDAPVRFYGTVAAWLHEQPASLT